MSQKLRIENIEEFEAAVRQQNLSAPNQQVDIIEYVQGVKEALSSLVDQVVVDQEESSRMVEQTKEALDEEKKKAEERTDFLEAQVKSLETKLNNRSIKLKETRKALKEANKALKVEQENSTQSTIDEDALVELKNQLHDAQEANLAAKDRISKLESALDEQADVVEAGQELKKHHEQQVAELAEATELLAAAKHGADSMKAELDPLRVELKQAQETIAAFDEKHASSIEALAQEQQESNAARNRIYTLESLLDKKIKRLENIKAERDGIVQTLSALQAERELTADEDAANLRELRDAQKQIAQLNDALEEEKRLRIESEQLHAQAIAENNPQALDQQLQQQQERIAALETTEQASADTIIRLQKEVALSQRNAEDEKVRSEELRERARATLDSDKQKDERIQQLESQLNSLQVEKNNQQNIHHHLHERIHTLEEEIKGALKLNEILRSQPAESSEKKTTTQIDVNLKVIETNNRLGTLLLKSEVITQEQLDEVLMERQRPDYDRSMRIGQQFIEKGYANEDVIAQAIAHQLKVPFLRIERNTVKYTAIRFVPRQLAQMHSCIPAYIQGGNLMLAMVNPMDLIAIEDIQRSSGLPVKVMIATRADILDAIKRYYK